MTQPAGPTGSASAPALLLEHLDAAVIATDEHLRVTAWNRGAERLFGWPAGDVLGRRIGTDLVPEAARPGVGALTDVLLGGRPVDGELTLQTRGGERVAVYSRVVPLREESGILTGYVGVSVDVSDSRAATRRLQEDHDAFRAQYDALPLPTFVFRTPSGAPADLGLADWNEAATRLTEGRVRGREGLRLTDVRHHYPDVAADLVTCLVERRATRREVTYGRSGQPRQLIAHCLYLPPDRVLLHAEDLTDRLAAERAYRQLVERLPVVTYLAERGSDARVTYVSPQIEGLLGWSPEEWLAHPGRWAAALHPDDRTRVLAAKEHCRQTGEPLSIEYRVFTRDGRLVWLLDEARVRSADEQHAGALAGMLTDVTDRKEVEERLVALAERDTLTGLMNRRRFLEDLDLAVARVSREARPSTLLLLDLDNFKVVNDSLGHAAGDELIRAAGRALSTRLRTSDTLARLGGDEFAVLLRGTPVGDALTLAEELLAGLRQPILGPEGDALRTTASIGLAEVVAEVTAEELLAGADLAMYEAKRGGRDRLAVYSDDLARQAEAGLTWSRRIRTALAEDRFVLHAQPVIDLVTGEVAHHELLLRLLDDDGSLIPPEAFLPAAERFALAPAVDRWVLARAVDLLGRHAAGGRRLVLSANLSGRALADPGFAGYIAALVRERGVDPAALILEVSEGVAGSDTRLLREFAAPLTRLGCQLALDDFGATLGSLRAMRHMPFHLLKIHGRLVQDLPRSSVDREVVRSISRIATSVGRRTVAESTADEATVELLREFGVDYAQGFHLGVPRPVDEL